jgi:hypothetical protein
VRPPAMDSMVMSPPRYLLVSAPRSPPPTSPITRKPIPQADELAFETAIDKGLLEPLVDGIPVHDQTPKKALMTTETSTREKTGTAPSHQFFVDVVITGVPFDVHPYATDDTDNGSDGQGQCGDGGLRKLSARRLLRRFLKFRLLSVPKACLLRRGMVAKHANSFFVFTVI